MAQRPMYQQIADTIRRQIEEGQLQPGEKLPTELELREKFSASRNTIRDAVKRLSALGLVETRPGQGTFVTVQADPFVTVLSSQPEPDLTHAGSGPPREDDSGVARQGDESGVDPEGAAYLSDVAKGHRKASKSTPRVEIQQPPKEVRNRLRVGPNAHVISRHQKRYIDDIPWSLQTSFYPMEFVTQGANQLLVAADIPEGIVRHLARTIGRQQKGYRDWITARQANDYEQAFFGIAPDAVVFELFRTAFDQNKEPMRVTVTVFPIDRNQFIYDAGDVPEPQYRDALEADDRAQTPADPVGGYKLSGSQPCG